MIEDYSAVCLLPPAKYEIVVNVSCDELGVQMIYTKYTFSLRARVVVGTPVSWPVANSIVKAHPGDIVQVLMEFTNTGDAPIGEDANGIVLKWYFQEPCTYVPGSNTLVNASYPQGTTLHDNIGGFFVNSKGGLDFLKNNFRGEYNLDRFFAGMVTEPSVGQNIGYYGPGANAGLLFSVKLPSQHELNELKGMIECIALCYTPNAATKLSTVGISIS